MTPAQRLSLVGILLVTALVTMDQTIVATALPRIAADLHGTAAYSWVATAYLLACAVVMPVAGRMTDLVSGRLLLIGSTVLFLAASALCGLAWGMNELVLFRLLQGLGGGAILAVTAGVAGLLFGPRERGTVMAWYGLVVGLSSVLGPLLGGFFSDHLSWRYVFYVNLPLGAVALAFLAWSMPPLAPEGQGRMDWAGAVTLALWSVPLLLACSGVSPWLLAVAAVFLALFLHLESRRADPMFALTLFKDPVFLWSSLAYWVLGGANVAAIIYLPLYLVQVQKVSATGSGLVLVPVVVGLVAGSMVTGRIVKHFGRYRLLLLVGGLLVVASLGYTAHHLIALKYAEITALMVLLGLGLGLTVPTFPLAVQNSVERSRMGTASSFLQFFRLMGGSMGVALLGTLVDNEPLLQGLQHVFQGATAMAVLALVFSLLIPEKPMP